MYIRRACLNEIGFFNVEHFGYGYGEENDFCLRATAMGWRHILTPNVFVRHYGAVSFGSSKDVRIKAALQVVERLHPGYIQSVGAFIREDPVRPYREALDIARIAERALRGAMLFVTHRLGGGTERHVQDMSRLLEEHGVAVFLCRTDPNHPNRLLIEDPGTPETPNLPTFDVARDVDRFARFLLRIRVAHVHIQNLAYFPESAPDFFRLACTAADLAYDVTIHDYIPVCPRINLIDRSGVYCGEPELAECERCIARDGSPFGYPAVWDWRERYSRLLRGARRVFVPNIDVARRLRRFLPGIAYTVRPHPEPFSTSLPAGLSRRLVDVPVALHRSRRIAVLGAIGPHKGSAILAETARTSLRRGLPLEFVVVGYTDRDAELGALSNVTITGAYQEDEALCRLLSADPDLAWFPAPLPETYSYTLSVAFAALVYPVAFDLGAIATRIRDAGWGELLPLERMLDPGWLAERLADLWIPKSPSDIARLQTSRCYSAPLTSYYEFTGGFRRP
jgi:glycosyltransferase involved in cell wall biosynthesis